MQAGTPVQMWVCISEALGSGSSTVGGETQIAAYTSLEGSRRLSWPAFCLLLHS